MWQIDPRDMKMLYSAANDGQLNSYILFYVGLALAILSNIFIGGSFILKKKGLLRLSLRAGEGGYGYLKDYVWWAGMISMGVGECCNFIAYTFAPATIVTPLGALSVLASAILASKCLNENLNILGKLGCSLSVLGSTVLIIHAPKEQDVKSMAELSIRIANPGFMLYTAFIATVSLILIFYASPRYGQRNPLVYVSITGLIGSLTVMGCKALGVALKQTVNGENQLNNLLTWFIIISVCTCVTVQLNYMNKALDIFNTAIVTPLLYVIFTGFVILASAILFKEWEGLKPEDCLGIFCGFLIILIGMFLLQGFKDLGISLNNLPNLIKNNELEKMGINYQALPPNSF